MSKARSCYPRALLILLAVGSMSAVALAQNDFPALRFQPTEPITFLSPSDSSVSVNDGIASRSSMSAKTPNNDGTVVAENAIAALPDAPAASGQTTQATPPPPQVHHVTRRVSYEARHWHVGGRVGVGFSPELFMFGLQTQIGPIFNPRLLFRPNVDFSFGELTDMFALNLEGAYFLRTAVYGRWTPYFGMGPSLNFIHQGTSTSDVSFSDFTYKTGFNVFVGGQKGKTFVEMKTSLWSGPAPVLRLLVGYNF